MDQTIYIAGFPTQILDVDLGSLRVPLRAVRQLEDFVDRDALLSNPDAPEPPYWAHLWTGARALARKIANEIDCTGKSVVDIGCGLGLTAVVAARRRGRVTAFDLDRAGVEFARANALLNDCQAEIFQADLRTLRLPQSIDFAFAADITYDPILQHAVAQFLAVHLNPGGRAWCAESVRTVDRGFQDTCRTLGFDVVESELREDDDGRSAIVRLTEIHRPQARTNS